MLVRWPSGTGTTEEYIAETAPRGWDSKVERYAFIGGGFLKKNLNAPRPSEHPPVRGKNVKTFRWDQ